MGGQPERALHRPRGRLTRSQQFRSGASDELGHGVPNAIARLDLSQSFLYGDRFSGRPCRHVRPGNQAMEFRSGQSKRVGLVDRVGHPPHGSFNVAAGVMCHQVAHQVGEPRPTKEGSTVDRMHSRIRIGVPDVMQDRCGDHLSSERGGNDVRSHVGNLATYLNRMPPPRLRQVVQQVGVQVRHYFGHGSTVPSSAHTKTGLPSRCVPNTTDCALSEWSIFSGLDPFAEYHLIQPAHALLGDFYDSFGCSCTRRVRN
ncbi:hypothetical protein FBY26_3983 [Phycicoccus sp. SLBN-51]|nr:hypothetical protein FBY26_3983 [Phycicoccus sp. SLBN-51]